MRIHLSDHFTYKRLITFVMPTIIMMIVTSIYSIVDGVFVSNVVGKNAFAAVNLMMPALMVIGSFGFMIGTGGSALISKTLGEGEGEKANRYFSMLILIIVVVGISFSVIGFILMGTIAELLGATAATMGYCTVYGRTVIVGMTFFMLQNTFQSFLVTAEKPRMGLAVSIGAGFCNVFLDFLFVYVFRMGVFGAAFATAFSQGVGALIPLIYFGRPNNSRLRLVRTQMDWKAFGQVCLNGSSEMLTSISASIVGMIYNYQLMHVAAEDGVAAYGVIMYVSMIFQGFFFGYAIGCAPIIGYNYGSGNQTELKNMFRKSLILIGGMAVLMKLSATVFAPALAGIFVGYDADLLAMTTNGLQIYSFAFLLSGFNIFGSAFFTALSNGPVSAAISFLRTLVFEVSAVLLLPCILGINGIWSAITVAEAMTLLVTTFFLIRNRNRYHYA